MLFFFNIISKTDTDYINSPKYICSFCIIISHSILIFLFHKLTFSFCIIISPKLLLFLQHHSLKMDNNNLSTAAQRGDINLLYSVLKDDRYALDSLDGIAFIDTPLHIAAMAGNMSFATEVMRLKPSFARKDGAPSI